MHRLEQQRRSATTCGTVVLTGFQPERLPRFLKTFATEGKAFVHDEMSVAASCCLGYLLHKFAEIIQTLFMWTAHVSSCALFLTHVHPPLRTAHVSLPNGSAYDLKADCGSSRA